MKITDFKYVYFLGIGGIGMSALARWFAINGFVVAGYDRTPTPLTNKLQTEGIAVHFDDDIAQIPLPFKENKAQTLVIFTPAIPANHAEYNFLKNNGFELQKRAQVLGLLAGGMFTLAVAGTHGKTTTSSMLAHLLRHSGVNCAAFLGGITQNYGTNLLINEPTDDLSQVFCVVEADEFDRSFLTLFPNIAVVTSTDADHLDIYGDHHSMLESFAAFVAQIKPNGHFFMQQSLELAAQTTAQTSTYSLQSGAYHAQNVRVENACFVFDIIYPNGHIENISMQVPGFHNVENAIAAAAVALEVGLSEAQIKTGLETFGGVKRRFEYYLKTDQKVLIDDYAHHPTEVEAFLRSVKALYPTRHLTAIFQPHLFSRTRDFAAEFAQSLSVANHLILLDIYPARELPIEGVTSALIFDQVTCLKTQCLKTDLLETLKNSPTDVVVTIGAGDIDQYIEPIKQLLQ
ncbi:MAG: UDP-N-acetylmuramate--L-alanine ligase [Runella slithyformis]|nr:MAG: UDP-N-acetylmuramate--L-alanine ligase [Runella slithyformis]TAE99157.1 MAG: UDP-N-acetylmuramate--L-alanine ligase [Runella slithyformis]TAF28187.1 MAG: UDP-N-acetylmuramate--L-alanine ligase [Runella slithyformis]TAF46835.1 MAG: UDP-N-acetylmuramate--L-alanine ligase [Runella slithyformis]TAF81848.1 MAG: UDP-N-acetylmuramate--L-alanine ligase [Runella slithyformis]